MNSKNERRLVLIDNNYITVDKEGGSLEPNVRVATHTLGCKVNQYETEAIRAEFKRRGYDLVSEDDYANIYVINTCTVTNLADRKSRQFIRRAKRMNPDSIVVVTGCYAQVKPEEVAKIEGVDLVLGTGEKASLVDYVEGRVKDSCPRAKIVSGPWENLTMYNELGNVVSMESRSRAFVKIQEGCNRYCSYCIIPYARGSVRSRSIPAIIQEIRALVSQGFKEIVLTGINTALYGREIGDSKALELLLREIDREEGDFRIRFSSLEPTVVNADFVKSILPYKRLCHHLHLSIQSGSNQIIKAMNRHYTREDYLEIVKVLRSFDPSYGITTDIIVGFPGESKEDFNDSLKMVEEAMYTRVHVFPYSKRDGTPAATRKDQVSPEVKKLRTNRLINKAEAIDLEFRKLCLGQTRQALIEEYIEEEGCYTGYLDNYTRVYIPRLKNMEIGSLAQVYIEECFKDGLRCRLVD